MPRVNDSVDQLTMWPFVLQDDPPDPEVYSDDASLDTTDHSSLCTTDFSRVLQDSHGSCADMTEFTGTTINLQDLEWHCSDTGEVSVAVEQMAASH